MMTEPTAAAEPRPLYDGHGLPVETLDPGKFEDFVFACLLCVADVLHIKISGKPSGSGDGGFDVLGESLRNSRTVCVQCKRQSQPLGSSQAAVELAKLAATSKLEGSDVGEHRFICTGGVRKTLRQQMRQVSRTDLAIEAGKQIALAKAGELATLRQKLEAAGHDARRVAESYVQKLDVLLAWSFQEFDVALSSRWDVILPVAERYFRVATVVREYPRAQFDRIAYVTEHRQFDLPAHPRLQNGPLPIGLSTISAADPAAQEAPARRSIARIDELAEVAPGELVMLVGDGGVGKTAVLNLIRAVALRSHIESVLPVLISLSTYLPGRLSHAIHQELGVYHGNWHSLPDDILLLCDGLNECSAAAINALLDEIKPLLRRKQLGCIISSRGDIGRSRTLLPQAPVACVHLAALTPMGIRRIAEHELDSRTAPSFLAVYRALTDRARTWLLWTPFAVRLAIKLWRQNSLLPNTLGGMLQQLIESRGRRHSERGVMNLSSEVTVQLARALAFEGLVVDQRLEYPDSEAGEWIRRAKQRCGSALGVADLTEREAVDLLIAHELLHRSATGYYTFQHQMIAGALAAPLLAEAWRDYTPTLRDAVSDDAWMYAGQFVPPAQRTEFLDAIFHRELQLGARAAAEIPDLWAHAQAVLDRCVAPESAEVIRIHGIFALGHLGNPQAIAKLRGMQKRPDEPLAHPVNMALALAGDQDYLGTLLPEVDAHRSGGVRVTGGTIEIWDTAPISARLDLARKRLNECTPGAPVSESLKLVAFEQDAGDVGLIEQHLHGAKHVFAWQAALYALHTVAPTRAKAAIDAALVSPTSTLIDKARAMQIAAGAGIDVDLNEAFRCAVAEEPDGNTAELHNLIRNVLSRRPLPFDLIRAVEEELPRSSGDRRKRLWQIAYECDSESIADYAASRLDIWADDAHEACFFFIAQTDRARSRRAQLVRACEQALDVPLGFANWTLQCALRLLEQLGSTAKSVNILCATLERLARVAQAAQRNQLDTLAAEDRAVLGGTLTGSPTVQMAILASSLVPLVARVHKILPANIPLLLLYFDLTSFSVANEMRIALSGHSDESIDQALQQIADPWITLSGLSIVCPRGATEVRTKLLERALRQYYAHPGALRFLTRTVSACWCESVLEMVLRTVAQIPEWSEYDAQFFWEFARMVAEKIQPENLPAIEQAASQARTPHARSVLQMWRTDTLGRRIGLGTGDSDRSTR
jgi:hypothetical protein